MFLPSENNPSQYIPFHSDTPIHPPYPHRIHYSCKGWTGIRCTQYCNFHHHDLSDKKHTLCSASEKILFSMKRNNYLVDTKHHRLFVLRWLWLQCCFAGASIMNFLCSLLKNWRYVEVTWNTETLVSSFLVHTHPIHARVTGTFVDVHFTVTSCPSHRTCAVEQFLVCNASAIVLTGFTQAWWL